jgi:hypothetical protein
MCPSGTDSLVSLVCLNGRRIVRHKAREGVRDPVASDGQRLGD